MTKAEAITEMYKGAILTHPYLLSTIGAKWVYITGGIRDHRGVFRADIWEHKEILDGWELWPNQEEEKKHTYSKPFPL